MVKHSDDNRYDNLYYKSRLLVVLVKVKNAGPIFCLCAFKNLYVVVYECVFVIIAFTSFPDNLDYV